MSERIRRFESKHPLAPALLDTLASLESEAGTIPASRRERLDRIAGHIGACRAAGEPALLTFICTHNSRRSQIAQLWAQVAAIHHGVDGVSASSGGTEITAFAPRAVDSLRHLGFEIRVIEGGANPHYEANLGPDTPTLVLFSKRTDDPTNPADGFCAVVTCASADAACPLVPGAALRVSLPYDDPKSADGTAEEAAAYDACCRLIGREMLYVFSRLG